MDFPTIKKPKANKVPTANIQGSKGSLFAKLEEMEQANTEYKPMPSAKTIESKPADFKGTVSTRKDGKDLLKAKTTTYTPGISAKTGSDESDIIKGAEAIETKVKDITKGDKSDKAEALRIRALLMKTRAQGLGEKGAMAEEENPKRKKKK